MILGGFMKKLIIMFSLVILSFSVVGCANYTFNKVDETSNITH